MTITIDGTAASGKTSAAERLAQELGYHLLKTGAMYRAAGLFLSEAGLNLAEKGRDEAGIRAAMAMMTFEMPTTGEVILNGVDFTSRIDTKEVGALASVVGLFPEVRTKLVAEQRRIAAGGNIVCEGRDQGTAVFPDAELKFYIDGDVTKRASRRQAQRGGDLTEIIKDLKDRDDRDMNREHGPLYPAPDAIRIDTAVMNLDQILDQMQNAVRQRHQRTK